MQYEFGLWVYDLCTGEVQANLRRSTGGFRLEPGSHLLAYGLGVEQEYFTTRGGLPDANWRPVSRATIWTAARAASW